jgi:hypothetical protein
MTTFLLHPFGVVSVLQKGADMLPSKGAWEKRDAPSFKSLTRTRHLSQTAPTEGLAYRTHEFARYLKVSTRVVGKIAL